MRDGDEVPGQVCWRVLGPIGVETTVGFTPIAGTHPAGVLATLLLEANRTVTLKALVDALWLAPPSNPEAGIRTYVAPLRRQLGAIEPMLAERLTTDRHAAGYRLRLSEGEIVDADWFEATLVQARRLLSANKVADARRALTDALAYWRGNAGSGLSPESPITSRLHELEQRRVDAQVDLAATLVADGDCGAAAHRLRHHVRHAVSGRTPGDRVAPFALQERPFELLMIAEYRRGHVAAALEVFHAIRNAFDEQLGLEPGERLTDLHAAILRRADNLLWDNAVLLGRPLQT